MLESLPIVEVLFFALTIISSIVYVILLSRIMDGWDDTPEWDIPKNYVGRTHVSIVIAARNEENNILNCLKSILRCNYPKSSYEIIVVDDHSSDNTNKLVTDLNHPSITILQLKEKEGKKSALEKGIHSAKGELILCTDADCLVPENWITAFSSFYEKTGAKCIAAPIIYDVNKSILQRFQYLDALNNMCVTANGIKKQSYYMANGANLGFTKSSFVELDGYEGNKNYASGDDMFLIQKIAQTYPGGVSFLKSRDTLVTTLPEKTFSDLVKQRTRWATKSKAYLNPDISKIQGFVFYFVLMILLNLVLSPLGTGLSLFGFMFSLFIKWTMDYLYLNKLADYFGEREPLKAFFPASLGFMFYILFAGFKALRPTKYEWKGRQTA